MYDSMIDIAKIQKIRDTVKKELEDIPRGILQQNIFRQAYSALRMHSLGSKAKGLVTKEEVFKEAEKLIRQNYPDFSATCNLGSDFDKKGVCKRKI